MPRIHLATALATALAASCSRPAPAPVRSDALPSAPSPTPTPPPDASDCVESCIARNQMKAVGIAQIRADCEQECNGVGVK